MEVQGKESKFPLLGQVAGREARVGHILEQKGPTFEFWLCPPLATCMTLDLLFSLCRAE